MTDDERILLIWMLFFDAIYAIAVYFYFVKGNFLRVRLSRGALIENSTLGYSLAKLSIDSKMHYRVLSMFGFSSPVLLFWVLSYMFIPIMFLDIFRESLLFLVGSILLGFCFTLEISDKEDVLVEDYDDPINNI